MGGQATITPDHHAQGFSPLSVEALRYDGHVDQPYEVAGLLKSLMPAGVRVLDVGCGTGSVTTIANGGKGNTVVALEPDAARVALAQARGIDARQGYLDQAFVAANGPFDVVMSSDVLEHMAAPAEALALFRRALRPGGRILISVPNVAHWTVRLNLLLGRFDFEPTGIMDATHLRWFTERTIRQLVENAGFRVVQIRQTAGTTLPPYMRGALGRIPNRVKRPLIRAATSTAPRLFGVQHVVEAVRTD